jgi:hypothetical protein
MFVNAECDRTAAVAGVDYSTMTLFARLGLIDVAAAECRNVIREKL